MIDEVIHAIKPEFEEYGVAEDVLAELQHVSSSSIILTHILNVCQLLLVM